MGYWSKIVGALSKLPKLSELRWRKAKRNLPEEGFDKDLALQRQLEELEEAKKRDRVLPQNVRGRENFENNGDYSWILNVEEWIRSGNFCLIKGSSNVHSIAYKKESSVLLVRFLHWEPGMPIGMKSGPGAVYAYFNQSEKDAFDFFVALSKGSWIWDKLRIRGTWAGHRVAYRLVGTRNEYVPRQAVDRGSSGEWFVPRRVYDVRNKHWIKSTLPERKAPPISYFTGLPNRAAPNRAAPNQGKPYRGTPDNGRF